jgi:hypothetical protein
MRIICKLGYYACTRTKQIIQKKKLQFARGFEQLRNNIVFDTNGALKDKPKDRTM